MTYTGARLEELLREYIKKLKGTNKWWQTKSAVRPISYIVLTDGVASKRPCLGGVVVFIDQIAADSPGVVISRYAKQLDALDCPLGQLGIQFVQIGDDQSATLALRQLDDELSKNGDIRVGCFI